MFNEIAYFLLLFSAFLSGMQCLLPTIGLYKKRPFITTLAHPISICNAIILIGCFGLLIRAFIVSDFSLSLVATNSHTLKPLMYKIAGTWGNHEGSLLLWTLVLAIMGAGIALFGKTTPYTLHYRTLSIQGLITVCFTLFMVCTSNPFERLASPPIDGMGLNPLLQDPGLAYHPPLLYLGYVGLGIAFSYAIAGLINGRIDASWASHMRPWVLLAWSALTAGIILGSWWAYNELGWGGFWFWDPVENASFMPWLTSTALLHLSLIHI